MPTTIPPLGLLLDVDGPIASPVSRSIAIPSIIDDLVTLCGLGVPIAFVTGRSESFIREHVVGPLIDAGLGPVLAGGGRMFGVCEKGGVWFPITEQGVGTVEIDHALALPQDYTEAIRQLVHSSFAETMEFDGTKYAMISVEQRTDVEHEAFVRAQPSFAAAAFDLLVDHGLGARFNDRVVADSDGHVPFRIDPTIISIDVESVLLDKDRGAERALGYFLGHGPVPTLWRTVGDSRSDYLMADFLHDAGYEVAHVDVRPSDGVLQKPYPVVVPDDLIHDHAGAWFLRQWVAKLTESG
ncbi:hypothetical protein [Homoserinimonas sp. OAct 916]|uniref:hypothetical protein n=1 Tax=Homoserinimonas sp. OAct 916 TaxID=2211450 RepID=UPI001E351ED4|nr:hypothetical protein [Homoserinimonas sp. OAct 916]